MLKYFRSIVNTVSSNILTLIIPLIFFVLPFICCKFYKKDEYNEGYLSLTQARIIKGFCALGIVLHHMSQETAASWLLSKYIIHGLDFFVDLGYLFVGVFLFMSGFGVYRSLKTKNNYFDTYISKRITPTIIAYLVTEFIYYLYEPVPSKYTWYIAAILVCYLLFYFAFKYCKKEFVSIFIVIFGLFIYTIICNFFMLGGWWYNTIYLFVVGLLYAKYEEKIYPIFKKFHLPLLALTIISTIIFRYYGRHLEDLAYSLTNESKYNLYSFLIILFRFLASVNFTFSIILISMKCEFKNKVLYFYGRISLEFYLIHGLFVQMFSYAYMNNDILPLYYIKNVPLYMLVVIVLATISAFVINYVDGKIMQFLLYFAEKRREEIKFVLRSLKKVLIVFVGAIVVYVLAYSVVSVVQSKGRDRVIKEYEDKYITYANVGNKKMAAYIVGQGKDTLVLLRGNDDPCPSITMRNLADELSKDYKVVVLDYLGTGFSDKPTSERTTKNIVYEIHEAIQDLGIKDKYILVPEYISGIYAQEYVNKYKKEIKAVIPIETESFLELREVLRNSGVSMMEYSKHIKTQSIKNYVLGRLMNIKGLDIFAWNVFVDTYKYCLDEDEFAVGQELVLKNLYNSTYVNERMHEVENYQKAQSQYPRNIYVTDILGNYDALMISRLGVSPDELRAKLCFDRSKHKVVRVNDLYKSFFIAPSIIKKVVDESIAEMK